MSCTVLEFKQPIPLNFLTTVDREVDKLGLSPTTRLHLASSLIKLYLSSQRTNHLLPVYITVFFLLSCFNNPPYNGEELVHALLLISCHWHSIIILFQQWVQVAPTDLTKRECVGRKNYMISLKRLLINLVVLIVCSLLNTTNLSFARFSSIKTKQKPALLIKA